ncbi:H/ACA ribonucleoprotein complex non-core subunit NAF1 [Lethenteron reissneri]|uniref:H/ACA ribonucleoprotein complex non-core subunit NAF1 n=1 Tax=Lethenteron reissneri TaxID=7753 RepID=UPI002AB74F71|nr:H/ACA ribonucleoprotein complex non-core subunit NAF1 [Lethenteron reissneri]
MSDTGEQTKMDCEDSISEVCSEGQKKYEESLDENNTSGTLLIQPQELMSSDLAVPQFDTPQMGVQGELRDTGESSSAIVVTSEADVSPQESVDMSGSELPKGPLCGQGELPFQKEVVATDSEEMDVKLIPDRAAEDSDSSDESTSSLSSASPTPVADDFEFGDDYFSSKSVPKVKVKGELDLEDLPPVPEVTIEIPEDVKMEPIGVVTSLLGQLVVVESLKDKSPLNEDTLLFSSDRKSVGKVFETFGPVTHPFYSLRFNSADDVTQKGIATGTTLYCTPEMTDYTQYIFTEKLKRLKGSDASWKDDIEPPPEAVDYSDDEQEKAAKGKNSQRANTRPEMAGAHLPRAEEQQHNPRGRGRARGRGRPNFEFSHMQPRGPFHDGNAFGQPWGPRPPMFHNRFRGPSHGGGRGFPPPAAPPPPPPYMHPGFPPQPPYWQGDSASFGHPGNYNPYFESREMGNFHARPPNVNAPRYRPPIRHEQMPFRRRNPNSPQPFY